uniref:Uncharacterized protein n=1 Tax=Oryza glaberrima TaxID=4538 RepID=A0A075BQ25_ORYGL|nr:hypothetical protein OG_BBa0035M03.10 [Oryza glaberrima]
MQQQYRVVGQPEQQRRQLRINVGLDLMLELLCLSVASLSPSDFLRRASPSSSGRHASPPPAAAAQNGVDRARWHSRRLSGGSTTDPSSSSSPLHPLPSLRRGRGDAVRCRAE